MDELNLQLCQELRNRNIQPVVALANPIPDEIRARWESIDVPVRILTYRRRWSFFWSLRRVLKEFSIDTVHIRFYRYYQLVSWLVRINGVRRIILTDAESGQAAATGLKRLLKRLRTNVATAPNVRMIAISEFVKKRLIESGVSEQKISVAYNGVDLTRFTPTADGRQLLESQFGFSQEELLLTTISRLTEVKRVDVLLRACAILHDQAIKMRLLIAGQGGPLREKLLDLTTELGIADRVTWIGQTPEPEFFLRGSDLFLLATEGEGFGNVLVEAMACGTPVVGSRSGAIPEIVQDGVCGLLAEPADPRSFADCIRLLAEDIDLRRQFGSAAIRRASAFGINQSVENTLRVYRSLDMLTHS